MTSKIPTPPTEPTQRQKARDLLICGAMWVWGMKYETARNWATAVVVESAGPRLKTMAEAVHVDLLRLMEDMAKEDPNG